jgi:hypothetical protein
MRLTPDTYPGEPPAANEPENAVTSLPPGFFCVFRSGHQVTVLASVNQGPVQLCLIDSGANVNFINTNVAKGLTKVRGDITQSCAAFKGAPARFPGLSERSRVLRVQTAITQEHEQ